MEDFFHHVIEIVCPGCGFANEVTLGQAAAEETVICLGCRAEIQLCDEGGSIVDAEQTLRQALAQFQHIKFQINL